MPATDIRGGARVWCGEGGRPEEPRSGQEGFESLTKMVSGEALRTASLLLRAWLPHSPETVFTKVAPSDSGHVCLYFVQDAALKPKSKTWAARKPEGLARPLKRHLRRPWSCPCFRDSEPPAPATGSVCPAPCGVLLVAYVQVKDLDGTQALHACTPLLAGRYRSLTAPHASAFPDVRCSLHR